MNYTSGKIKVRYNETDQMGIVHHSNYLKFFELARIEWLENDNYKAPLHYVFVLNNQYDPDHVVQLQPEDIKPKITFDDKLHACLLAKYKSRMPIQFEVPIYEIGTKREPAETKKVIEAIISK